MLGLTRWMAFRFSSTPAAAGRLYPLLGIAFSEKQLGDNVCVRHSHVKSTIKGVQQLDMQESYTRFLELADQKNAEYFRGTK